MKCHISPRESYHLSNFLFLDRFLILNNFLNFFLAEKFDFPLKLYFSFTETRFRKWTIPISRTENHKLWHKIKGINLRIKFWFSLFEIQKFFKINLPMVLESLFLLFQFSIVRGTLLDLRGPSTRNKKLFYFKMSHRSMTRKFSAIVRK